MNPSSTWRLPEQATSAQFNALLGQLDDTSLIDASALQRFDTATLALLLEACRRAKRSARSFEVINAPPRLLDLARLHGVEELLFSETPR
ncbi:STAS domain-containing protein [Pseudomonas sp. C11]|uniref:STAS domain-containing protein n=1 Tax=Pseudomonas sp. C11 TaxID=3075550 RepID=UPI002B000137|nr:STAS domain-containing protein [Pseudomonas sp. C11]